MASETHTAAQLNRIALAIEAAQCPGREGPYGLYDYTSYGAQKPHRVRDFRDPRSEAWGDTVFASDDAATSRQQYERLTREHVALAAIHAVQAEAARVTARPSS